jgi:hypothetical protein
MPQARSRLKAKLLRSAALLLALSLGACNKPTAVTGGHEPNGPLTTDEPARNAPANASVAAQTGQAGELPAAGAVPRFVGQWAADQESCDSAAWQFTASALRTPAGGSCSFNQATDVPGGYDIQATCAAAKDPPASDTIKIRFAESAKAMLFDSKTLGNTGLVFCGRDA